MFKNNKYIFGARFGSFIGWIRQAAAAEPQISSVHNLGPKACSIHCGLNLYIAFVQQAAGLMLLQPGENLFRQYYYSWILLSRRAVAQLSKLVKMSRSKSDAFYVAAIFSKLNQLKK